MHKTNSWPSKDSKEPVKPEWTPLSLGCQYNGFHFAAWLGVDCVAVLLANTVGSVWLLIADWRWYQAWGLVALEMEFIIFHCEKSDWADRGAGFFQADWESQAFLCPLCCVGHPLPFGCGNGVTDCTAICFEVTLWHCLSCIASVLAISLLAPL